MYILSYALQTIATLKQIVEALMDKFGSHEHELTGLLRLSNDVRHDEYRVLETSLLSESSHHCPNTK